jgi:hypothetical protein
MRTDSADVRPNARLISIKCRIRAVSARVARGERSRARRGARNLWKFCKWPKSVGRSAGAASAARYSAGPPLPLSPIDGAEKFLRKKDPGKKSGREISPAAGGAPPLQTECLLRVVAEYPATTMFVRYQSYRFHVPTMHVTLQVRSCACGPRTCEPPDCLQRTARPNRRGVRF